MIFITGGCPATGSGGAADAAEAETVTPNATVARIYKRAKSSVLSTGGRVAGGKKEAAAAAPVPNFDSEEKDIANPMSNDEIRHLSLDINKLPS